MFGLSRKAAWCCLIILFGLLTALPSLLPASYRERLPTWYGDNAMTLGLDLRGGSHLLLAVDADDLMLSVNRQMADSLSQRLREAGLRYQEPVVDVKGLRLTLREPARLDEARRLARELDPGSGGAQRAYDLSTSGDLLRLELLPLYRDRAVSDAVEQSLEVVRRRLDEGGLVEPSITRQGDNGIEVQLPGVSEPGRIRELLGTTAKMSFHWAARPGGSEPTMILPGQAAEERYPLEEAVAMEGRHVVDAQVAYRQDSGQVVVNFRLDREGGRQFGEMTQQNVGRALAVVLDGRVITAPVIRTPILGGSGEISGAFSTNEATDLAVMLRAGALPAKLDVIEEHSVGPNLGSDAIRLGISSGVAGGLLVLAFMMLCYGQWGFIAWIGLAVNVVLIFAVLGLLRGTLTLPGIAGIILGFGMAVDANILINERIREERRRGRSAWRSLELGFGKAWATILDSNMTGLIAVSLLFLIGSGPVRGFATTMAIGLFTSLFTAVTVTRLLMEWRVKRLGRKHLDMGGLPLLERLSARYGEGGKVIPFMKAGSTGLLLSALLSTASVVLMLKPGLDYGIDFSGGALLEVHSESVGIEELRAAVEASRFSDISLQEFGGPHDFQLRLPLADTADNDSPVMEEIKAIVLEVAADAEFPRADLVGPRVSGDFADLSILAVLLAGLGMLGYLWYRFENHFAVAAILTIALDITKTMGFFALSGVEFNLTAVAALLALIGYSVNDKVVVFDRVRENLREQPDEPLERLLNRSIGSTLTRTVLTSGSTLLALLPMALFGGSAVASFAWPMLFGIVVGTSSSIFIAAPLLLQLGKRRARRGLPQIGLRETQADAGEEVKEGDVLLAPR